MNKLRKIGTRFTEYTSSYTKDFEGNQIGYERFEYTYEVIGHSTDSINRPIELLKPIRPEDE